MYAFVRFLKVFVNFVRLLFAKIFAESENTEGTAVFQSF